MKSRRNRTKVPNKKLAAVCGLFCPACTIYIASTEDRPRLKALSARFGVPEADMECHGCRSEKRGLYCNKYCKMTGCASERGVDFCSQCPEFPCEELKLFQGQMPHRIELWQSLQRLKTAGLRTWYAEMVKHYSCAACGTINSAYDRKCRTCATVPSCAYAKLHEADVARFQHRMGP